MKPGETLHLVKKVISHKDQVTMTVELTPKAHVVVLVLEMFPTGEPMNFDLEKRMALLGWVRAPT